MGYSPEFEQSFSPDTDAKGGSTSSSTTSALGSTALGAAGVSKP